jgi:excisionase family DNA binding protein
VSPAMSEPPRDDLLRTSDIARILGIAERTVCLWAECSQLPAIKVGRQWRFPRKAFENYLKHLPTNEPRL